MKEKLRSKRVHSIHLRYVDIRIVCMASGARARLALNFVLCVKVVAVSFILAAAAAAAVAEGKIANTYNNFAIIACYLLIYNILFFASSLRPKRVLGACKTSIISEKCERVLCSTHNSIGHEVAAVATATAAIYVCCVLWTRYAVWCMHGIHSFICAVQDR